jgi:histidine ammonia-lyase
VDSSAGRLRIPCAPPGDVTTSDYVTGAVQHWREAGPEGLDAIGGRLVLEAKEGLALSNGATVSAALLALLANDCARLLRLAEVALAMTLEAARGFRDAFLPEVHAARPHPGAAGVAARVLSYVKGSTLLDPAGRDEDPGRVPPQDPYSIRCAPQVIGAAWDVLAFARTTVEIEINAAVDNPLIFLELPRDYKTVSCGNFHGAPLGYALDALKVVLTDCASQSERRTFKLTDYRFDDAARRDLALPAFLVASAPGMEGLNSGLMISQYTAAALVSACKTLAHPDSVDSIPSSANQEDHVSMSMNAGLHARAIAEKAEAVLAIELLTAAQALDLRATAGSMGAGTAAAHAAIRAVVPTLSHDRPLTGDIEAVVRLMRMGTILEAAERGVAEA